MMQVDIEMFLITFFELLFLKSCKMLGDLWQASSPLPSCFLVLILLFNTSMGSMKRGSPLLNNFQARSKVTP
jgi:hypothetical protein